MSSIHTIHIKSMADGMVFLPEAMRERIARLLPTMNDKDLKTLEDMLHAMQEREVNFMGEIQKVDTTFSEGLGKHLDEAYRQELERLQAQTAAQSDEELEDIQDQISQA